MTTDKSSEREALKPCPFCGGEASQRTEHDSDMIRWGYIGCRCGVRTRGKFGDLCPQTWAEIRGEWNARAALPQQAQEAPSDDLRELGKWLNEEPNRPIDRSALARVLAWAQVSAPQQQEALTRLWPLFERAIKDLVFTADRAGEVMADMNTLRAAIAKGERHE